MIYLIKAAEFHKIGYTSGRKADERIRSMQTSNPHALELVGLWEGSPKDEAALHVHFGHRRVRGEWFSLTAEDLAEFARIASAHFAELPPAPINPPPSLPSLKFPEGINVEVKGVMCTWCARWMRFIGTDYLVCEHCNLKWPIDQIVCHYAYRKPVFETMRKHACS